MRELFQLSQQDYKGLRKKLLFSVANTKCSNKFMLICQGAVQIRRLSLVY